MDANLPCAFCERFGAPSRLANLPLCDRCHGYFAGLSAKDMFLGLVVEMRRLATKQEKVERSLSDVRAQLATLQQTVGKLSRRVVGGDGEAGRIRERIALVKKEMAALKKQAEEFVE